MSEVQHQDPVNQLTGKRLSEGLVPEVEVLLHAVERVDSDYPGVPELCEKLGPERSR